MNRRDALGVIYFSAFAAACSSEPVSDQNFRWTRLPKAMPWGRRDAGAAILHRGRIWILGGWSVGENNVAVTHCDTWSSADCQSWRAHSQPAWRHGIFQAATSFRGRLWTLGGYRTGALGSDSTTNEIWSSLDGERWEQPSRLPPWTPRMGAGLAVHNGEMWLTGGKRRRTGDSSHLMSDVWRSRDGLIWSRVADTAPWGPRAYHGSISFAGRLWVIGGGDWDSRHAHSDVWSTVDGVDWMRHVDAPWAARIWHSCVVWNDRILVIGGRKFQPWTRTVSDIWQSRDGSIWTRVRLPINPGPRHAAYVVSDGGVVWLMGGSRDGSLWDDCWRLE